jgi:hypothetical protein
MIQFRLRPNQTVFVLGIIWCVILAGWAATQYYKRHVAPNRIALLESAGQHVDDTTRAAIENPRGIVKLFDLDGEVNIPEMYQTLGLVACAVLLFAIAAQQKATRSSLRRYWIVLAWMFLFLALDSGCSIHNNFHVYTAHTAAQEKKQGIFYFSWTLAYGAIMLPIGLWYLGFLFKLPRKTAIHILVAGVIYVGGAMGMEMVFGSYLAHGGAKGSHYQLIFTTIEESMETIGTLLFIQVLLKHMVDLGIAFSVLPTPDAKGVPASTTMPAKAPDGKHLVHAL